MEEGDRTFTVVDVFTSKQKKSEKNEGGRFVSKTPSGAASKAFTDICNQSKIHGVCSLFISVQETTQGSQGKIYKYKVSRRKYDTPVSLDKTSDVSFRYYNTLHSLNQNRKTLPKIVTKKSAPKSKSLPKKKLVSKKKISLKKSSPKSKLTKKKTRKIRTPKDLLSKFGLIDTLKS